MDKVEPRRAKSRSDSEEPMSAKLSTDNDDPMREKLRRESDEPSLAYSNTDRLELTRSIPHTESVDPTLAN